MSATKATCFPSGESVGARLTVVASGVPSGWGEPLYGRLDADIAQVMMGINAVKGVEIGAGFRSVEQHGTEHSDEMAPQGAFAGLSDYRIWLLCLADVGLITATPAVVA